LLSEKHNTGVFGDFSIQYHPIAIKNDRWIRNRKRLAGSDNNEMINFVPFLAELALNPMFDSSIELFSGSSVHPISSSNNSWWRNGKHS
jgi:hypothetical protein